MGKCSNYGATKEEEGVGCGGVGLGVVFHLANKCPFYGKEEESLEHILIHCPLIWGLWAALFATFAINWICPYLVKDLHGSWMQFPVRKNLRL